MAASLLTVLVRTRRAVDHDEMTEVRCLVVRWVADEPQPGLVEAQLTDADGRLWSFIDKEPIFCRDSVSRRTSFPVLAVIRCLILTRETSADGREIVTIDTANPDGVDSDGITIFCVPATAVSRD
jgi:hypothetical protein